MLRDLQSLIDATPEGSPVMVPSGEWSGGVLPRHGRLVAAGHSTIIRGAITFTDGGSVVGALMRVPHGPLLKLGKSEWRTSPRIVAERHVWWCLVAPRFTRALAPRKEG